MNPVSVFINNYYKDKAEAEEFADYQNNFCWCGIDFECFNCRNADMPQGGE